MCFMLKCVSGYMYMLLSLIYSGMVTRPRLSHTICFITDISKYRYFNVIIFFNILFERQQTRLKQSKQRFSESAFCSGGDNNPGLIMSPPREQVPQLIVNDSIVGRESNGFIAKVLYCAPYYCCWSTNSQSFLVRCHPNN